MAALVLFTYLDDTLLLQSGDFTPLLPVIQRLQAANTPLIPVVSESRSEIELCRAKLGLNSPFAIEQGSALYLPRDHCPFPLPEGEDEGPYRVIQFGVPYVMVRAGLKAIAQEIGRPLKGFGDLSVEQVQQLTGWDTTRAQQAKTREFTEPFLTPKNVEPAALQAAAAAMGFQVVVGDRFSQVIGAEVSKSAALEYLASLYQSALPPAQSLVTVGLGRHADDLEMLKVVDRAIVIPADAGPQPTLMNPAWEIAPRSGLAGWAIAMTQLLDTLSHP